MKEASITIKMTESELEKCIYGIKSIIDVPVNDGNNEWKEPFRKLHSDMESILNEAKEKKEEIYKSLESGSEQSVSDSNGVKGNSKANIKFERVGSNLVCSACD